MMMDDGLVRVGDSARRNLVNITISEIPLVITDIKFRPDNLTTTYTTCPPVPKTGGRIRFEGTGFPSRALTSRDKFNVYIEGTLCTRTPNGATFYECIYQPFATNNPEIIFISMTGESYTLPPLTTATLPTEIVSVSPSSYSPVLKTELVVTWTGSATFVVGGLTAWFDGPDDTRIDLRVMAVDNTAKTITIKYPGAYGGHYQLNVQCAAEGHLGLLDFYAEALITGISHNSGSMNGGQEVTITGQNFSPICNEQQVVFKKEVLDITDCSSTHLTVVTPMR